MLTVAASSSTGVKALSTATKSTSDPPVVPKKLPSAVSSLRGADYGGIHSHRPSADSGEVGDPGESRGIPGLALLEVKVRKLWVFNSATLATLENQVDRDKAFFIWHAMQIPDWEIRFAVRLFIKDKSKRKKIWKEFNKFRQDNTETGE